MWTNRSFWIPISFAVALFSLLISQTNPVDKIASIFNTFTLNRNVTSSSDPHEQLLTSRYCHEPGTKTCFCQCSSKPGPDGEVRLWSNDIPWDWATSSYPNGNTNNCKDHCTIEHGQPCKNPNCEDNCPETALPCGRESPYPQCECFCASPDGVVYPHGPVRFSHQCRTKCPELVIDNQSGYTACDMGHKNPNGCVQLQKCPDCPKGSEMVSGNCEVICGPGFERVNGKCEKVCVPTDWKRDATGRCRRVVCAGGHFDGDEWFDAIPNGKIWYECTTGGVKTEVECKPGYIWDNGVKCVKYVL